MSVNKTHSNKSLPLWSCGTAAIRFWKDSHLTFRFYDSGKKGNSSLRSDHRSKVSQKLIWDAMFALLCEKPFDSIHVKDICQRANVNRSTFYNHFTDKYELLQFGLHEVVLREAGIKTDDGPLKEPPHHLLFEYVYSHQEFWKNILLASHANDFISETLIESSESFFDGAYASQIAECDNVVPNDDPNGFPAPGNPGGISFVISETPPPSILARMYFGAVGSLTAFWLNENCRTPIDQLDTWVDTVWDFGIPNIEELPRSARHGKS